MAALLTLSGFRQAARGAIRAVYTGAGALVLATDRESEAMG